MKLSDRVYRLNLGVPKEFEDMSAYSAYLGNGVVSLEKERDELKHTLDNAIDEVRERVEQNTRLMIENERLLDGINAMLEKLKYHSVTPIKAVISSLEALAEGKDDGV